MANSCGPFAWNYALYFHRKGQMGKNRMYHNKFFCKNLCEIFEDNHKTGYDDCQGNFKTLQSGFLVFGKRYKIP